MISKEITFPHLHPGQRAAAESTARFRLLACGRRWGKTRFLAYEAVKALLHGQKVWHVAPTYSIGNVAFRSMVSLARPIPSVRIKVGEKKILWSKGSIEIKSADYPNNLRGEGLDLITLDEAAFVPKDLWGSVLRPALMDRQGRGIFASSPNGKNWFYDAFKSRQFKSWQNPTWTSPYIDAAEIEDMRRERTKAQFSQEVAAEFIDFEGRVFPVFKTLEPITVPQDGQGSVFGVDVARSPDATAVAIAPCDAARVWTVLQTHRDYSQQIDWLRMLIARWKPRCVVIEENGVGAPMFDMLRRVASVQVVAFTTTNKSKTELIDALILRMEQDEYALPEEPDVVSQFDVYTCSKNALGTYTFGGPEGSHDDAVMAVLLACYAQVLAGQSMTAFRI